MIQEAWVIWAAIRRLVRWWQFIGGREFGVYVVLVLSSISRNPHLTTVVQYVLAFISLGILGYWLNDMFDEQSDRAARKRNAYALCRSSFRPLVTATLIVMVGYAWKDLFKVPGVAALVLVQLLLLVSYSAPPLRLKARGWWGSLADALYGSTIPAAMTLLLFAPELPYGRYVVGGYLLLTFLRGLRSILMHQVEDRIHDRAAHILTVPVRYGTRSIWQAVWYWIIPLETGLLLLLGGALALLYSIYAVVIVSLIAILLIRSDLTGSSRVGRIRARYQWRYWCNTLYERWIPLGAVFELLIREPSLWPIAVAFLFLFPRLVPDLRSDADIVSRFVKRHRRQLQRAS